MPRTYASRRRAESAAATRSRIVETARALIPNGENLPVDRIAQEAGVSVQTLYTHFGSKRGLLLAVIDTVQRDVGLYMDLERVWSSPDGETALRQMIDATFRLWHGAWPLVGFSERARRSDAEIEAYMREVDGYRRANLLSITDRLAIERRLRGPLDAGSAADLALAMSQPSVYEQLVRVQGWQLDRAARAIVDAIVQTVIDPAVPPVMDPPADWSTAARPSEAVGLDRAGS